MSQLLLKTQKNEIFEVLKVHELGHTEFIWSKEKSDYNEYEVSVLTHNPTEYFFKFDFNTNQNHCCKYSPADGKRRSTVFTGNWYDQTEHVHIWAVCLEEELDAPDLWDLAKSTKDLVKHDFEEDDNSKFSNEEIDKINGKLDELSDYIVKTSNLNTEQLSFLNSRIDYLKSSAERVTKKDWKIIFIGVLFNLIVGLGLSAAKANDIMSIATQLFSEFYTKLLIN